MDIFWLIWFLSLLGEFKLFLQCFYEKNDKFLIGRENTFQNYFELLQQQQQQQQQQQHKIFSAQKCRTEMNHQA